MQRRITTVSSAAVRTKAPAFGLIAIATTFVAIALWLCLPSVVRAADELPAPSSAFAPEEVVEIVVDALQRNAEFTDDAGIATVFEFASPGNRASTGPLERFSTMIKRGFGDMLTFRSSRFEPMEVADDHAVQVVWLMQPDGSETGYAFQLGRQDGGEYDAMWMTDAVVPLGPGPRSGTSI